MLELSLFAVLLAALSGAPGLVCGERSLFGQRIATILLVGGAALGALAAIVGLAGGSAETGELPGPLPGLALHLRLDPLAAFFLVPVYALGAAGALYGERYWRQAEHPENGRKLRLCFGVLIAALAGVVLAGDGVAFLFAWEIMALSAFLLVTTEDERAEARQAGWIYLVSTHIGTLALFALFGLWWSVNGSLELRPLSSLVAAPGVAISLFLLALVGFGLKAGIVPMHFWLPPAHANAPSHVSALLSGVMLKIGIYGLLRILTLLPAPPLALGMAMLAIGTASALYGVLFALGQHDVKRLLAYHSVENIGIIAMGLGLALIGVSEKQPAWIALGLGGCLLHVWNHALFKALLFLAGGAAIHAVGTREIGRFGGLARSMPRTASLFAIGSVAICGLPPLNGFVSELLIYVGLMRVDAGSSAGAASFAPLAAPLLAMAGALAIACFVKVFGAVFLGPVRSEAAARAHEPPHAMLLAMTPLALGCVAIGVFPAVLMPTLDHVVRAWAPLELPPPSLSTLVPWPELMATNGALIAIALAGALWIRSRSLRRGTARAVTWDCGYARPGPRMAYTASSFADILVGLHGWLLRPRAENAVSSESFPASRSFHSSVRDPVMESVLAPLWAGVRRLLVPLRVVQQGRVQQYLVYVLVTLCLLLASLFSIEGVLMRLLGW
ncbi:MAG TPA: proton-conducting transporter membrane subunit [Myxococcota bacterium]|nr:proton-conducting transporter membrane subunit [Myxococcota bacterium]